MSNDTIANFLTMIRNAQMAKHRDVDAPATKITGNILKVLAEEGFIAGYEEKESSDGFNKYQVSLKYFDDNTPVMSSIKRISKSGCRVYTNVDQMHKVKSGLGLAIVSTSQGVLSDREAKKRNIGGEVLAVVG